ncbi:NAD(P)/FAD-dependent oxidoreductase [Thalassolituus sp. ST750PaO-4]|uniref:phytoene desaturase family protein n=1 Tax=Thalassolituus sp. ST750PaO-4 TaxID=2742965 RepID=UPI001CE337C6|nr:NAD(P)/FAD-dependent oxidoreductase [Thalassolituus sp. ST750PaO-4]MCA6060328.1 NAD(P)/FAD-dependent oxidoreductase [Thalassolituus sp. ST750PaO-4]
MSKVKVRTGTRFRANRADSHYDVIVIGSGMGGLTTAAFLSLLGQKVAVLEQHYTAGGFTHAYDREGFEWDVGVHYIGEVHKPSTLRRVFDVVSEGRLQWAEMEPEYDRIILGKEEYGFIAGRDNFAAMLKERFPQEAQAIDRYIELIREMSRKTPRFFAGQAMPPLLARAYNLIRPLLLPKEFFQTTREVLENLTSNQQLISVLTGQWGDYGQTPTDAAFIMHALIAKHYLAGGAYPVGGASAIARTIIPTIQKSGGEVFTYADVDEIIVRNNRACGVRLANGTELMAGRVVSNAGFWNTTQRLLPADVRKKLGTERWAKQVQRSSAHYCIYAGFDGTAEELGLNTTNLWIYPSADHEGNLQRYYDDPEQEFPVVYISFPSAKDPDWNNRFPGKSTVEIVTVAKHEWFSQWSGSTWNQRGEEYDNIKARVSERLLEKLYQRLPQLRDKLVFQELSTPLSSDWFQKSTAGEIYGLDHFVDRFKKPFLHPVTPVKNLYMTGADVMTAGVGGALMAGMMTACAMQGRKAGEVLKLLKEWQPPQPDETETTKETTAKKNAGQTETA